MGKALLECPFGHKSPLTTSVQTHCGLWRTKMTPVVVWDVIRGIILPSAVLPQPMGPRNLPFAFAYALCPAGTLYRNFLPITNVCVPTRNVIEPKKIMKGKQKKIGSATGRGTMLRISKHPGDTSPVRRCRKLKKLAALRGIEPRFDD